MSNPPEPVSYLVLSASLQIHFWTRLQVLRSEYLAESLAQTVASLDITHVDAELAAIVGKERLGALAAYTLRGEAWYAVPCVLRAKPLLLGYYRLLYGISQKDFYSRGPFGRFKALEADNRLTAANAALLPALCASLAVTGGELFSGVAPISAAGIHELQLLTLGPQFRGSQNNVIGQGATRSVFDLIRRLVQPHVEASTDQSMTIRNASGRTVRIVFASDPDIAIVEALSTQTVTTVSIEIKGGADVSNVHNRIGEAEKSHQKARLTGCNQFWTILKASIDDVTARQESPTTTAFFNLDEILIEGTPGHARFRDLLTQTIGVA
jgi:hypothetical protein